jgi:triosephosphate isomerase
MRRKLVIGNWKMNGSMASVTELVAGLKPLQVDGVGVAVCPPFVYLPLVVDALADSAIAVGAQNVSEQSSGAFTGEVSASMLADFGCRYVLIGHSERREYQAESDQLVAAKFKALQAAGLTPVLCLGESLVQREAGGTLAFVEAQLRAVIDAVGIAAFKPAVVAYEPIWAIGTGLTATPEQAQEVHAHLRAVLSVYDRSVAQNVPLLYGGSVNAANAEQLFAEQDIDGALVGGASLKVEEFAAIIAAAQ